MNIEKLYQARKQKGFSQEDLASLCNVSRQTVSKWETGQSVPDANSLVALSRALDLSIDYLLDNERGSPQLHSDYQELLKAEEAYHTFEYRSKKELFNIPLVHIHFTRRMMSPYGMIRRTSAKTAKGIIAIGDRAIGLIAIGYLAIGIFSLGIVGFALLGLSVIQFGFYSFGILSIGFLAVGIIALGIYALGIVAIGLKVAIGIATIGEIAIGVSARGSKFVMSLKDQNIKTLCELSKSQYQSVVDIKDKVYLPALLRQVLTIILRC